MSQFDEFLEKGPWVFAKSMPDIPHEWLSRDNAGNDELFTETVRHIYKHGKAEKFGKRTFYYLYLNGYKHWCMNFKPEETTIINRALVYDGIVRDYERLLQSGKYSELDHRMINEVLPVKGSHLDVGCGSGWYLDYAGWKDGYLGIDPSIKMLNEAQKKHPYAQLIKTTLEDYDGPPFDNVTAFCSGQYLSDPEKLLKLWNGTGVLFASFFDMETGPCILNKELDVDTGGYLYNADTLEAIYGVVPDKVENYFFVTLKPTH